MPDGSMIREHGTEFWKWRQLLMEGHYLFKWYKLLILQVYHTIDPFASPILIIGKNRRGESLHEQENGNAKRRMEIQKGESPFCAAYTAHSQQEFSLSFYPILLILRSAGHRNRFSLHYRTSILLI